MLCLTVYRRRRTRLERRQSGGSKQNVSVSKNWPVYAREDVTNVVEGEADEAAETLTDAAHETQGRLLQDGDVTMTTITEGHHHHATLTAMFPVGPGDGARLRTVLRLRHHRGDGGGTHQFLRVHRLGNDEVLAVTAQCHGSELLNDVEIVHHHGGVDLAR